MGWASGGRIFDPVAKALIDNDVPDETVTNVLAGLIEKLTDGDWDTLDESIEQFREFPAVIAAFERAAPQWLDDGDVPEPL